MRAHLLLLLLAACPLGVRGACADHHAAPAPAGETAAAGAAPTPFALSDRNANGEVDREEFQARQTEIFFFADTDRDGRLRQAEIVAVTREGFDAADRDDDGALSLKEYQNARAKDFDAADANADGALGAAEAGVRR